LYSDKKGLNPRGILKIIRANEGDEFLVCANQIYFKFQQAYFPAYAKLYCSIKSKFDQLAKKLSYYHTKLQDCKGDSFEIALDDCCQQPLHKEALRQMKSGKFNSMKIMLAEYDINNLWQMIEREEVEESKQSDKVFLSSVHGMATKTKKKKKKPLSGNANSYEIDDVSLVPGKNTQNSKLQADSSDEEQHTEPSRSSINRFAMPEFTEDNSAEGIDSILEEYKDVGKRRNKDHPPGTAHLKRDSKKKGQH
jgi:hypothetical protein